MIELLIKIVQSDKAIHFYIGYLLTTLLQPWYIGFIITVVLGVIKEIYDRKTPGHVSDILDLVAIVAGGLIGLLIIITYQQ